MTASVGVKTTECGCVPAWGTVAGSAKANEPGTEPEPPSRVEAARVWPWTIPEAVGQTETVGMICLTSSVAAALTTAPRTLLTTTSYTPASAKVALAMTRFVAVSPTSGTPSRRHWWKSGAKPTAATANSAPSP